MPILAAPVTIPAPDPIRPPDAYIETPHMVRRMLTNQLTDWCVPLTELPAGTPPSPGHADAACGGVAQAQISVYAACVQRLTGIPEVLARPGERVRFHVADSAGTAALSVLAGDVIEHRLGPLAPWTARRRVPGDPPALVSVVATGPRGTVDYRARLVVAPDISPPPARVNVSRRRRAIEVTPPPGSTVSLCVWWDETLALSTGPAVRRDVRGTARFPFQSPFPYAATILVRNPAGVGRVVRIRPR